MKKKNKVHWRKLALLICIFISYLSPPSAFAQPYEGGECIYLNPVGLDPAYEVNNYLYITYNAPGIATYTMPPSTAAYNEACLTFCLQDCEITGAFTGTIGNNVGNFLLNYHFSITGPGYTFDDSMWPAGGPYCFTLPAVGLYNITVTEISTGSVFMTSSINVVPSVSISDPMVIDLSPDKVCDCDSIASQFPEAIVNHDQYFAVHWQIDGGTNEYKNPDCGIHSPGIHSMGVTGLDGCGNPYYGSKIFEVLPPNVTFEANQINCYDVDVNPLYQCIDSTIVTDFYWEFGDGTTSTASNPGPHHYSTPGTYHITMTCSDGSITYGYELDVTISTAALATVTGPTVSCGSPLTYTITGAASVSSFSISPASAASISASAIPNQYTVTVSDPSQPFTITFAYTDRKGCEGVVTYNVKACCPDANTPLTISGPDYTCSTTGLYGVTAATGGSVVYNWTITPATAGTITTGAGTQNVTINWANQFTPATITVTATNENGCTQTATFNVNACCLSVQSVPASAYYTDPSAPSSLTAYLGVWTGTTTSTTSLTGKSIYVFENLTINTNFTFDNCVIWVAPGKSITLNAGITVNWVNGQVREMCNEMWEGIFTYTPTAHIIANGTIFRSAIHALNSYNGGDIDLTGCELRNDYVGLTVKNYTTGPHPVTVQDCDFRTTTVLIPPYAGRQTHKCIDIDAVSDITIGSTTLAATNTFLKADYGIHIFNSNVKTFNATYTKIQPTALSVMEPASDGCPLGSGICDRNNKKLPVFNLQVGQTVVLDNKFNQCTYGVYTNGKINEKIQYSEMNNVTGGVVIGNNNGTTIDVSPRNEFKNYTYGTYLYNVPNANISIDSNYYNYLYPVLSPPATGDYGIVISNPTTVFYKAQIVLNYIDRTKNGIYLLNSTGITGFSGPPQISVYNNRIDYKHIPNPTGTLGGMEQNGIRVENSQAISVTYNQITRPLYNVNLTPASVVGYLRGIKITNSPFVLVAHNQAYGFGEGVRAYGNCNNNLYICNNLERNYNAFNFEGPTGFATVGPQLPLDYPQANNYGLFHSVGFDLEGYIQPTVKWLWNGPAAFYNATSGLVPGSTTDGPSFGTEDTYTSTHSFTESCGINYFAPGSDPRQQTVGGMVGTVTYPDLDPEFTMFDRVNAFRALKRNPGWLTMGTPEDITYQDFFNASLSNGISSFDSVATSIGLDSLNTARMVNASITTTGDYEYNLKRVNELYLNALDSGFTAADSLELYDIAYQNGTIGGPGVYHARAILRLYLDDLNGGEVRMEQIENQQQTAEPVSGLVVYPNPNTGVFYLKLDNANIDQAYTVEITDMQGKMILGESFVYKGEAKALNLSAENGVYMLILRNKDQQVMKHERIIVSK